MIPKQLFFIWIGEQIPSFASYSLEAFRSLNPKFSIDFLHYTNNDIVTCQDSVINYVKSLIFKTKQGINNKYYRYIKHRIDSKFNFIQILSDVIRFEYLYYYGGIYLDCDTFPVRPFDDKLLDHTEFDVTISWGQNQFIIRDVFFLGKCPKTYLEKNPPKYTLLYPHTETGKYHELKKKFFDCTLKYGEYYGDPKFYYINHYHDFTWNPKNLKVPLCKWDDILKDKK